MTRQGTEPGHLSRVALISICGLLAILSLCGISGIAWRWASTREMPEKAAVSVGGTRFVVDRLGLSTCITMEYRTLPGQAGPQLNHRSWVLRLPDILGGERLGQIDLATLVGHQTLRQHVFCWS